VLEDGFLRSVDVRTSGDEEAFFIDENCSSLRLSNAARHVSF